MRHCQLFVHGKSRPGQGSGWAPHTAIDGIKAGMTGRATCAVQVYVQELTGALHPVQTAWLVC